MGWDPWCVLVPRTVADHIGRSGDGQYARILDHQSRLALGLSHHCHGHICQLYRVCLLYRRDSCTVSFASGHHLCCSTIEKIHQYRLEHHPVPPSGVLGSLTPRVIMDRLGWMGAMVSSGEARVVFGRAFSRPPRLLFTNPVCLIFSLYYAYIYGESRFTNRSQAQQSSTSSSSVFLSCMHPLRSAGQGFFRTSGIAISCPLPILVCVSSLRSYQLTPSVVGFGIAMVIGVLYQDRMYKALTRRAGEGQGHPEYRVSFSVLPDTPLSRSLDSSY